MAVISGWSVATNVGGLCASNKLQPAGDTRLGTAANATPGSAKTVAAAEKRSSKRAPAFQLCRLGVVRGPFISIPRPRNSYTPAPRPSYEPCRSPTGRGQESSPSQVLMKQFIAKLGGTLWGLSASLASSGVSPDWFTLIPHSSGEIPMYPSTSDGAPVYWTKAL